MMKILLLTALLLSSNSFELGEEVRTPSELSFLENDLLVEEENGSDGKYEKCFLLLGVIVADSIKLSTAIATHQYQVAVPLAFKIMNNIVRDINCFKEGIQGIDFDGILSRLSHSEDCFTKHMRNAVIAIKQVIENIKLGLKKEALEQFVIAMKEIILAQACPKTLNN